MKNIFSLLAFSFLTSVSFSQAPLIEWQNTIGGSGTDYMYIVHQTSDGGYILGGKSDSDISGDKTENSNGGEDIWVVKLDASGIVAWQNTIGGSGTDDLKDLEQTADGGYILGGYSDSDISGDKTENSNGAYDYWVIKLDATGNIVWQNTIGGSSQEQLFSIQQTLDGGYILGGRSNSNISGDKTENSNGQDDFWAVKLDVTGNIVWQNTIGGTGNEAIYSISQTTDGGYIVGGYSSSSISGDKTENSINPGAIDYWVIKLDAIGNIIWQNTIGGSNVDELNNVQQTLDGGYILTGRSKSDISGDKTENSNGGFDFWVVKLDATGNIVWQNTIGGSGNDEIYFNNAVQQTSDGGYILGGTSLSNISGDKTENLNGVVDYWIVKIDGVGNIVWQNSIGGNSVQVGWTVQQTSDDGFIFGGHSNSSISGDKTENSNGGFDFWVVKLYFPPAPVACFSATPNPANCGQTVNFDATCSYHEDVAKTIDVYEWDFENDGTFDATGSTSSTSFLGSGTYTVKLRVTDNAGDMDSTTVVVTVNDAVNPTASNPVGLNANCSGSVPAPDVLVVTDEADNCSSAPVVAFVSDVSDGNTCPEVITRTYSVTDGASNQIVVTQTITVNDFTMPTASNPVSINTDCLGNVPAPDVLVVTDEADNCSVPTVAFVSDVSDGNTCPEIITRTYSVTDACTNQIMVTQTITVNDVTSPSASNPTAINVDCLGNVPAPDVLDITDEADNCSVPTVAFVSDVSDGNSCPEVITRTYSVTDACTNQILVTQTITVSDLTNPSASSPSDIVLSSGGAPAPDVLVVTDEADNCTANPVVAFVSDVSDGNTCPETITRTYSVTDDCNNQITLVQNVIINDQVMPTASNPVSINVECTSNVPAPDVLVVTDEADDCGTPVVAFVSDVSDGNTCPETITRTYSVTDGASNQIAVTQTITVNDATNPTASNPAGINVDCIGNVPSPDVLDVTDEADNCGIPTVAFVSDVSDGNTCPEVITRTYSVMDDCNNTINVTQTISVNDVTNPTASNPANVSVECLTDAPIDILDVTDEVDNCTTAPVVAYVSDVSDGNTCPEVITRTYSVTDDCNNTINVTQTITVDDTTGPIADVATLSDVTEECESTPTAPTATDNCTGTITGVSDITLPITTMGTTLVTWTYTDDCGNTASQTQNVIVTAMDTSVTQSGELLTANSTAGTYQWLDCNDNFSVISGETNQAFTATLNGSYAVEVTIGNCADTSACYDVSGIGFLENSFGDALTVYPNPTSGDVKISLGALCENITVQLKSINGQLIETYNYQSAENIDVEITGADGLYLIDIKTEAGETAVIKVLKK
ncbi:MAG: hypothetical protein ACI857_000057 [Arenicella sp.]|jgi:hypothetical protein